jgi:hypothetical protein
VGDFIVTVLEGTRDFCCFLGRRGAIALA